MRTYINVFLCKNIDKKQYFEFDLTFKATFAGSVSYTPTSDAMTITLSFNT